jgi:hypothetical protein
MINEDRQNFENFPNQLLTNIPKINQNGCFKGASIDFTTKNGH